MLDMDAPSEWVLDGHPQCPNCGYDLRGCALPSPCPECGLAVSQDLLTGLIPWERRPNERLAARCAATAFEALLQPRRYYARLGSRIDTPVFHAWSLITTWVATSACIILVSAVVLSIGRVLYFVAFESDIPPWEVVHREFSWFDSSLLSCMGPFLAWGLCWFLAAILMTALAQKPHKVLQFRSALCLLGPLMLLCQAASSIDIIVDDLTPLTATMKPMIPIASVVLVYGLLLCWGVHLFGTWWPQRQRIGRVP